MVIDIDAWKKRQQPRPSVEAAPSPAQKQQEAQKDILERLVGCRDMLDSLSPDPLEDPVEALHRTLLDVSTRKSTMEYTLQWENGDPVKLSEDGGEPFLIRKTDGVIPVDNKYKPLLSDTYIYLFPFRWGTTDYLKMYGTIGEPRGRINQLTYQKENGVWKVHQKTRATKWMEAPTPEKFLGEAVNNNVHSGKIREEHFKFLPSPLRRSPKPRAELRVA